MTELHDIKTIAESFEGILLDAYGVFWGGNTLGLLPGTPERMEDLVSTGKAVGILTNTTQRGGKEVLKLKKHGLHQGVHFHFLITAGDIAYDAFINDALPFATPKKKYWLSHDVHPLFSSPHSLFEGTSFVEAATIDEADFIYVSIPHLDGEDQTDPELFRSHTESLISSDLPMVCANPDHFAKEGNPPRPVVRQGSVAKIYENVGGTVYYFGKPSSSAYTAAMLEFSKYNITSPSQVLMVGDTPETDIKGARNVAMASALVTETGITAENIARDGLEAVIATLEAAKTPDFYIKTL